MGNYGTKVLSLVNGSVLILTRGKITRCVETQASGSSGSDGDDGSSGDRKRASTARFTPGI